LEVTRERYSTDAIAQATAAYDKILTRYPVMESSDAAKQRLLALKQPVPRPTKAMLAQNKAEEAARHEPTTMASVMSVLSRHPDVSAATNVGEPTLQDKDLVSAKDLVAAANRAAIGGPAANNVTAGIVKDAPTENERAPRSDDPAAPHTDAAVASDSQPDPNELKPTTNTTATTQQAAASDPNELTPNVPQDARPAAPPPQVNEIPLEGKNGGGANASSSQGSNQDLASDEMISSSKHKKKKGLHKIIPLS
jgi:outer membrane protein assembly factor BamD